MKIPNLQNRLLAGIPGAVVVPIVLILVWKLSVTVLEPPAFLVPPPEAVWKVLIEQSDYLLTHAIITFQEMMLGLAIGSAFGVLVALILAHSRIVEQFLKPVIVASQTLPVFAIAPLLVIWFGLGLGSKVVMASLIIFFPVASALYDGLKSTPQTWLDLAKLWRVSPWQLLLHIRLPAALPSLASGLKIAATLAPIGAIVGEWAGAAGGLGFVMLQANARVQTDMVFAAILVLAVSAVLLRLIVTLITDRLLFWSNKI